MYVFQLKCSNESVSLKSHEFCRLQGIMLSPGALG